MDMFNIVPIYSALVSRQRTTDAQRQVEWEAREADRVHRERARELKHKKIIDHDSWRRFPARLRIRKHASETSTSSADDADPEPPRATAIRWADE
ncbi:hypothetical protein GGI03_000317 [Coemansia sp. RSA 2337]|nr:hypothetical protein GGI14_004455 [Coemansia sp. S680]KAJ2035328.1 hypothetical protein H4S03_004389 [Coemansia sp. S3946]KAJ2110192.1 hypothetical protein GGI16_000399 [Coemansia sp. S142-1]KAJ2345849.1 hypothetical protein GGH92_003874 [Coemansia sp. RSA 2673]KAJ2469501.1 hypothetical protein GGI03_000317 [Coemansia sp. RSA 2337]